MTSTIKTSRSQLKAIKHVQELAKDYQKNKNHIEKELLQLFKSYGIPLKKNVK
jgi:hypothetical protein